MQIVIDVPEDVRNRVAFGITYREDFQIIGEAIANGTPLPKGHGDLIDRAELYNQTAEWEAQALEQVNKYHPEINRDEWRWWSAVLKERGAFKHDVADAPTIVEADKEE